MASETFFLSALPSIAANSKSPLTLSGILPDGYELHSLFVSVEGTIKQTATGGAATLAAADHNTLMALAVSRVRLAAWGVEDAVNLTPSELRTLGIYATGKDPFTADVNARVGGAIPANGGTANTIRMIVPIMFVHRSLDTPEIACPSTDQFNVPGHKLTVELGAQTGFGTSVALAGGSAVFTLTGINVYACVQPAQFVHFGPAHYQRQLGISTNRYAEDGRGWDWLLADERDPYTVEGQVQQINIIRDTRNSPLNVPPGALAAHYFFEQPPADGITNADLLKNTLGGTGSQVTPYAFFAHNRPSEWQYNGIFRRNRTIFQNLAAGGSAAATLLLWQVRPLDESFREMVKMVNRYQLSISSVDDLAYRYGPVNADFKGRYLATKGSIKAP